MQSVFCQRQLLLILGTALRGENESGQPPGKPALDCTTHWGGRPEPSGPGPKSTTVPAPASGGLSQLAPCQNLPSCPHSHTGARLPLNHSQLNGCFSDLYGATRTAAAPPCTPPVATLPCAAGAQPTNPQGPHVCS